VRHAQLGWVIFARGSTDNKGQNLAHILGVEQTLAEDGDLPVNVRAFLIEGEEESRERTPRARSWNRTARNWPAT